GPGAAIARHPATTARQASMTETRSTPAGRTGTEPRDPPRRPATTNPSARAAAIGMLSQKIVCQDAMLRINPPYSGPRTLPSSWTPPTTPAAVGRPEIRDQGQGHGHETTAPEALERPACDHRAEVGRGRRHERTGGEDREAQEQERPAA